MRMLPCRTGIFQALVRKLIAIQQASHGVHERRGRLRCFVPHADLATCAARIRQPPDDAAPSAQRTCLPSLRLRLRARSRCRRARQRVGREGRRALTSTMRVYVKSPRTRGPLRREDTIELISMLAYTYVRTYIHTYIHIQEPIQSVYADLSRWL